MEFFHFLYVPYFSLNDFVTGSFSCSDSVIGSLHFSMQCRQVVSGGMGWQDPPHNFLKHQSIMPQNPSQKPSGPGANSEQLLLNVFKYYNA